MWREGVIGVPVGDSKYTGLWYQAKVYDLPSEYGIEGGRISKLQLRAGGLLCRRGTFEGGPEDAAKQRSENRPHPASVKLPHGTSSP